MNEKSLSHTIVKNQLKSSWIDDAMGFTMGTGVRSMSHKQELQDFAMEMAGRFGKYDRFMEQYYVSLDDLTTPLQLELAALFIESIDRNIENACYGSDGNINSSFLCSLLSMLKNNNADTRRDFVATVMCNVLTYYRGNLDLILSEGCDAFAAYEKAYRNEQRYDSEE